ncbi:UvrD-helicase domain-containing protein [Vibrio fluvialis]|uniref:UvrD-helicase domain-containing protein n=1 Tax=Vibrio fluvialis TaxID=676 RepID=UPI00130299E4|nr:UvrD-helicase domain-containing protein [Vibrio fluvialis]
MTDIHSLLSCQFDPDGIPFTDEDIRWVEGILGLNDGFDSHQLKVLRNLSNIDVEACPGSGKTTVLVAKLALLARYWKPKSQGICVLSMTNAAREEIQERLGCTSEGQKLLHPPHFIGTIHSFFSDYLAKPFLNSNNMAIVSIDDDFCRSQRRKTLQKTPYLALTDHLIKEQVQKRVDIIEHSSATSKKYIEAKEWLDEHNEKSIAEQRLGVPVHWKMVDIDYNVLTDKGKSLDLPDELLPTLRSVVKEVVDKGIFGFSDIFVYSHALMEKSPKVYNVIRTRFPFLLIDEAQDTSCSQAEIIHKLFMSDSGSDSPRTTRQRFGDANQTIYTFEPPMPENGIDFYPSPLVPTLTIPVSHRFDESIAKLVSSFETNPLAIPMEGKRISQKEQNHCILLFGEETRSSVIPTFSEFVAKELDPDCLTTAKIRVCSHIQKEKEEEATGDDYARTISDYYSQYVPDKLTREYTQHSYFIDYIKHGRFLVKETLHVGQGLEKIAEGLFKACLIAGEKSPEAFISTPFYKIKSMNNKHRSLIRALPESISNLYVENALKCLVHTTSITEGIWADFIVIAQDVLRNLLNYKLDGIEHLKFLSWVQESNQASTLNTNQFSLEEKSNIYRHMLSGDKEFIDIKLGTIHSVKGQTHTATLLLESTNRGPILGQLKHYILGNESASNSEKTKKSWLNTLYVGLTRPTHLVCIAIPESHKKTANSAPINWTQEDIDSLKKNGWKVARVNQEWTINFI